jgi:predicted MFS family arabinose efflux permease
VAALRYVRYSPAICRVALRAGIVMFFASAILALLPSIAHRASGSPLGFGFLLGCFGAGAIAGALLLQPAHSRWSTESVASASVIILGVTIVGTAVLRGLSPLGTLMLISGSAWVIFIALLSVLVQNLAPDWVRARVLAIYMLVFQGGMAAGSDAVGFYWRPMGHRDRSCLCRGGGNCGNGARVRVEITGRPRGRQPMEPLAHARAHRRR